MLLNESFLSKMCGLVISQLKVFCAQLQGLWVFEVSFRHRKFLCPFPQDCYYHPCQSTLILLLVDEKHDQPPGLRWMQAAGLGFEQAFGINVCSVGSVLQASRITSVVQFSPLLPPAMGMENTQPAGLEPVGSCILASEGDAHLGPCLLGWKRGILFPRTCYFCDFFR